MTGDLGGQSVWPYRKTGKELKSVAMDRVEGHLIDATTAGPTAA